MSKKNVRWRRMYLPKIENIQISEKNIGLRAFAVGVLLLVAAIFLGRALTDFLNTEPGWQTVAVESDVVNVSTEFNFTYDFSDYGGAASAAYKKLILDYSTATEDAYRIFHEEVENLNSHVNEAVTVDPALYHALSMIVAHDNRNLFLAPVYQAYSGIFLSGTSGEAVHYDPTKNEELGAEVAVMASYANDPEMIRLELLENNQVRLCVSVAYLTFADEHELDRFVDLNWMTNAFVVDYLADTMIAKGYTCGYIASYDGFTRNLDSRGNSYNFNLYDRRDFTVYPAGMLQYTEPVSIVFLRRYPLDSSDWLHYFEYADGSVTTVFIDPADGMSKAAVENLVCYSKNIGCAEILLQAAPVFVADSFDRSALDALSGISSVWFEDMNLCTNDAEAVIELNDQYGYSLKK